jgi:hypothetical protein
MREVHLQPGSHQRGGCQIEATRDASKQAVGLRLEPGVVGTSDPPDRVAGGVRKRVGQPGEERTEFASPGRITREVDRGKWRREPACCPIECLMIR